MSTTQAPASSAASVDRSVRLMVLGGLQIFLGCLCALAALMLASLVIGGRMPQGPQGPPFSPRMMIPGLVIYVAIAAGFLCVGIGMIGCRRWAWKVTVVLSWMGLIFGLFASVSSQLFMGRNYWESIAEQSQMPPEMVRGMWIITMITTIGIYVLLPGLFVLLCQPKSVRDTVYRSDPRPHWIDHCPMPVLALSLFEAFAAVSALSVIAFNGIPLFGYFLSGPVGVLVTCLFAIILALLAWGTFRLKMLAWWGTLLFGIVGGLNTAFMLRPGYILTMYEKMGFSAETIDMIRKTGALDMLTSPVAMCMNLAFAAAWFGYLLYVRRYFVRKTEVANIGRN
jgi:hypothetical protein